MTRSPATAAGTRVWPGEGPSSRRRQAGPRRRQASDRPAAVAAAVLVGAVTFVSCRLAWAAHGDPTRFVMAERPFANPARTPRGLFVMPKNGYDGQFFYRLAINPIHLHRTAFGITFDNAYRVQRIGYPLLAWLAAAGHATVVPGALIAVNVAALTVIAWLGAELAQDSGRHAAWGLLMVTFSGFVITLARDTSEIVAVCFMLGGVLAIRCQAFLLAGLLLAFAALTRETAMVLVGAVALTRLISVARGRARPGRADLMWILPSVAFVGWQLAVLDVTGVLPIRQDKGDNIAAPFTAAVPALVHNLRNISHPATAAWVLEFAFLAMTAVLAAICLPSTTAPVHERLAFVLYAVQAVCPASGIWTGLADLRSLEELYVFAIIVLLGSRRRLRVVAVGAGLVLVVVAAHRLLRL
jgi:hypothetical protein